MHISRSATESQAEDSYGKVLKKIISLFLIYACQRLARELKAWQGLKHPNVLELLGYYLSPSWDIAQLISPYPINGNIREYLDRGPVRVTQRLAFVSARRPNPPSCS